MILIGELAEKANISKRTLYHYEQIGLTASEGPSWPWSGLLLFGYCIVMVLPAFVLLVGRLVAHRTLKRPLARLDKWLTKNAQSTTAWVIGIVGFLLTVYAIYD